MVVWKVQKIFLVGTRRYILSILTGENMAQAYINKIAGKKMDGIKREVIVVLWI